MDHGLWIGRIYLWVRGLALIWAVLVLALTIPALAAPSVGALAQLAGTLLVIVPDGWVRGTGKPDWWGTTRQAGLGLAILVAVAALVFELGGGAEAATVAFVATAHAWAALAADGLRVGAGFDTEGFPGWA